MADQPPALPRRIRPRTPLSPVVVIVVVALVLLMAWALADTMRQVRRQESTPATSTVPSR